MTEKEMMDVIAGRVETCKACPLSETRSNVVPGEGNVRSPLMFVGEGPGEEEDKTGRPFVGRAGKLFDKILESVRLNREDMYIANIVKCRPPNNRVPTAEETSACSHHLMAQISVVKPKLIIPLGATAFKFFLPDVSASITASRGKFFDWKGGIRIFPMFHPSYLLRQPSREPGAPKSLTWEDIKTLKKLYDGFIEERNSEEMR